MPDRPQLRWLYVPDLGHLLVLTDHYNPVDNTVHVLDLSLAHKAHGAELPSFRIHVSALVAPRNYPRTLLGVWKQQAWARWRILRDEQRTKALKDGRCSWNSKQRDQDLELAERRDAIRRRRKEHSRAFGKRTRRL